MGKHPCQGRGTGVSCRRTPVMARLAARPLFVSTRGQGAASQISWRSPGVPWGGMESPCRVLGVLDRGWSPDLTRFRAGTRVPGEGVRGTGPEWSALPVPLQCRPPAGLWLDVPRGTPRSRRTASTRGSPGRRRPASCPPRRASRCSGRRFPGRSPAACPARR